MNRREDLLVVSAVYFPSTRDVEATWERGDKKVMITFPVTAEQGELLAEIVSPCVYVAAKPTEREGSR